MSQSIDSCQNRVFADQYHLTVSRAQVSTQISKWLWTRKFSQLLQAGKTVAFDFFLIMVTRWLPSTSNFYALIGQNLASEFMQKIFAASGNLFTDSWVLCHLVTFLTIFFHLMYKMKYSCFQESWVAACQSHRKIRFRMASFSKMSLLKFTLLDT